MPAIRDNFQNDSRILAQYGQGNQQMSRVNSGAGRGGQGGYFPGMFQDMAMGGMMGDQYGRTMNENPIYSALTNGLFQGFSGGAGAIGGALGQIGNAFGQAAQTRQADEQMKFARQQAGLGGTGQRSGAPIGSTHGATPNSKYMPVTYKDTFNNEIQVKPWEVEQQNKMQLLSMLMGLMGGGAAGGGLGGDLLKGFASNTGQSAFMPGAFPPGELQPYPFYKLAQA